MILNDIDNLIEEGLQSFYQNNKGKILGATALAATGGLAASGYLGTGAAAGMMKGIGAVKTAAAPAISHIKANPMFKSTIDYAKKNIMNPAAKYMQNQKTVAAANVLRARHSINSGK